MTTPVEEPQATTPKTKSPLWMRVLGIRKRGTDVKRLKLVRYAPSFWGWCILGFVVFIGGGAAFAEYSMQPDFCRSCHIMEPYYQAWHTSTHKDVACTLCHFEPGLQNTLRGKFEASNQAVKYITNTYGSKPHAEIKDVSCMRSGCHEKRLLEGKVNWTVETPNGNKVTIKFDHTPHLTETRRGKQLRCVSCHSQIVQGKHLVVTLDTCFLCHFKGKEYGRNETVIGGCNGCHNAPKEKIRLATGMFDHSDYAGKGVACENCHSDSIQGDGAVHRQVCWNCHNKPEQVAKMGETTRIHDEHVTKHKVECSSCHIAIEHNLTAAAKPPTNAGAHAAFDPGGCGQCHEQLHGGPAELFRGTGGRGVPDMPSPMFRAQVDCIACHRLRQQTDSVAEVVGQTFKATQDSCNYCHGTKYEGVLDDWKRRINQHVDRAEATMLDAKKRMAAINPGGMEQLKFQRLLDDADFNIRLVKLGHGVHNVAYSTALLNAAIEWCNQVKPTVQQASTVGGAP